MHVLVTGGAGYIGSTLTGVLLEAGHRVTAVDNLSQGANALLGFWAHPEYRFIRGDIGSSDTMTRALNGIDAVVHLAAIVGDPACAREPDLAKRVNERGSLNLLDRCEDAGVERLVFASTCSNYGRMADPTQFVSEGSELCPISLYAETKVSVERAILADQTGTSLCKTVLRFATVYGASPRMRFDLTVNDFTAEMMLRGKLVVYGEQFWRPYVHVRDAARAVATVLESPVDLVSGEVYNVGSDPENYRKQDLVDLLMERIPDAAVEYVQKDEDPRDYRVTFGKIAETLGYETTSTVAEGIDEVMRMIKNGLVENVDDPIYRN